MIIKSEIFGPPIKVDSITQTDLSELKAKNKIRTDVVRTETKDLENPYSYINSKQAKDDGFSVPGNCRISVGGKIFCPGPTLLKALNPFVREGVQRPLDPQTGQPKGQ